MRRLDYAHPRRASASFALGRFVVDRRVRGRLIAAGGVALILAALTAVESARYFIAAQEADTLAARFAVVEDQAVHVRLLSTQVHQLEAIATRAQRLRASGPQTASGIAALGNQLPRDVWITSLRRGAGTIALEGHGARLAAIPKALMALAVLPDARPRLVTVAVDPARGGITYALTLRDGT